MTLSGPFHVELECADLDATYEQFQELVISTQGPPTARSWGDRDFLVLDPDGNLVELGQHRARSTDSHTPPTIFRDHGIRLAIGINNWLETPSVQSVARFGC